ncbi:phosphoribosylaminoimidazolesuccinocarboxamide synthase [bacterium]|nr:phosphoribosylaminoimidazolesuccinocarboxamide synthase [bacterium]
MNKTVVVAGHKTLISTDLPFLTPFKKGKVREVYEIGEHLLIIATDRISAFDVVMDTPIPKKGVYLTAQSSYWFKELEKAGYPTHFVTDDFDEIVKITGITELNSVKDDLDGRVMLGKKAAALPIEAICRFRIFGSALSALKNSTWIWEPITLEGELEPGVKIVNGPAFTPTDKSETDEKITFEQMTELVGNDKNLALQVKELSVGIFQFANKKAIAELGFEIADGKVEYGILNDELILIDETFTSDSTRFMPDKSKEVFRQWLISNGLKGKAATIPDDVAMEVSKLYREQCQSMGITLK